MRAYFHVTLNASICHPERSRRVVCTKPFDCAQGDKLFFTHI
jgi:hypothetical protein